MSHRYLLSRAAVLKCQCERGADLVLEQAHLDLAQQTFKHSKDVGRLTWLGTWVAVLYVPLSFVTSVFGMDFAEFGSVDKPLWIWAIISVPVLLMSILGLVLEDRFEGLLAHFQ